MTNEMVLSKYSNLREKNKLPIEQLFLFDWIRYLGLVNINFTSDNGDTIYR